MSVMEAEFYGFLPVPSFGLAVSRGWVGKGQVWPGPPRSLWSSQGDHTSSQAETSQSDCNMGSSGMGPGRCHEAWVLLAWLPTLLVHCCPWQGTGEGPSEFPLV